MADKSGQNNSEGYGPQHSDVLRKYHDIPEEDRKKAQVFFDRAKTVADTGNFEYGIELYIQGLTVDPENAEAHQALREVSLKRKASGGKDMGFMDKMKLPKAKDDKQNMLNSEKLLAYDPGNTDRMLAVLQHAYKAGFYDTVLWVGPILQKANVDSKKPDFNKFIALKGIYEELEEYKLATEACHYARTLRPEDMDLQHELKNLDAKQTMKGGKYGTARTFRDSVRNRELQDKLLEDERDVHGEDALLRGIREAQVDWENNPDDWSKFTKLIDALRRPEQIEHENRAIELLEEAYQKTNQFKWRQRIGEIKMAQLSRQERALRQELERDRTNPAVIQKCKDFQQERARLEMGEFQLILDHYPTDSNARYQVAKRMFELGQLNEAIPVFQQVRSDPKFRVSATLLLGQAFLASGFVDEAVDTLRGVIDEYPNRGDERSVHMYYLYGIALEKKGDVQLALKQYSQVAQWNFNFRDVQTRIKRLRGGGPTDENQT